MTEPPVFYYDLNSPYDDAIGGIPTLRFDERLYWGDDQLETAAGD